MFFLASVSILQELSKYNGDKDKRQENVADILLDSDSGERSIRFRFFFFYWQKTWSIRKNIVTTFGKHVVFYLGRYFEISTVSPSLAGSFEPEIFRQIYAENVRFSSSRSRFCVKGSLRLTSQKRSGCGRIFVVRTLQFINVLILSTTMVTP